MRYLTYFLLSIILLNFIACSTSKETAVKKVEEKVEVKTKIRTTIDSLTQEEKSIKQALEHYLKQLSTFNTDTIVDLTYPKLFYVIDLDLFRQYITSMMNSTDIEMTSYTTQVTQLSKVITFTNATKFSQASYISNIDIHFLNEKLYNSEKKVNFLYDALAYKYGKKNIKFNKEKRILSIRKIEKLLIIKEKDSEWKFLGDNSKYRKLYPSFLPPEILKVIKTKQTIIRKDTNETT